MLVHSLSSKAPHVNNGGGNESVMEEVLVLRRGSGDGDRRRDSDTRDQDPVDGTTELINHHRGSVDKLRSHTLGYQVGETEQRHEGGGSFLF